MKSESRSPGSSPRITSSAVKRRPVALRRAATDVTLLVEGAQVLLPLLGPRPGPDFVPTIVETVMA
jgi:hypothetical protein